jgi:hypothetical protein
MSKGEVALGMFIAFCFTAIICTLCIWGIVANGRSEVTTRYVRSICISNGGQIIDGNCIKTYK